MKIQMLTLRYSGVALLAAVFLSVTAAAALAQKITGTLGEPCATITIQGNQIPGRSVR